MLGMEKQIGTNSVGQLKISIAPHVLPKAPWKPFNQEEEFDRKAKQSVLYNMETPTLDKYLKGGK
tara:strand:+ start:139 stop:333 length:195 start_codon:yes stop_codon:yes gene_type:complete